MTEDVVIPRRGRMELDSIEGNLIMDKGTVSAAQLGGIIHVSGATECKDDCLFESSLTTSELTGRNGNIVVKGDLNVENSIKIRRGRLFVEGSLTAKRMEVDKQVEVDGDLDITEASVGGSMKIRGNSKADRIGVGGSLVVDNDAEIGVIDVGGSTHIRGRTKGRVIDVGGSYTGDGPVEVDSI